MTRRVERVRLGLIAGSVLLLVALAGLFSYARYRAGKAWIARLKTRSGATFEQEADNVTYSQSLRGRTVFTLRAAKRFSHANGISTLHNVVITFYGSDNRVDRVYGNEFEWDEDGGIARAVGEVQMDLQVPSGVVTSQRRGSPATAGADGGANSIHVRTSGLVFLRKLGVAATREQIEFHYGGLTCIAKGAEFNNNPSSLHLLADVQMNGELRGKPVELRAAKADFDRASNVVAFAGPVLTTGDRKARAQSAVLHLRRDGSVERAEAMGDVMLDQGTRHVGAPRLDAALDEKNQPQTAKFSGGVRMVDDDTARPAKGEAGEVRMRFDAQGRPVEVTALNGAHLLAREVRAKGVWLEREMRGDQVVGTFHAVGAGKPTLKKIHAIGAASMRGDSLAKAVGARASGLKPGLKSTSVAGDDLLLNFVPGAGQRVRPDTLHGRGHTVLRQTAELGEEHTSAGDVLDAVFAADDDAGGAEKQFAVASATQVGHVVISSRAALKPGAKKAADVFTGNAERATYDGESERLSLSGNVHLADAGTSLVADAVMFDQQSGDAEAHGSVAATLTGSGANVSQATHVAAQQALLHKATQVAEFDGGAGKPARLWQEASQVEAAQIVVDRLKNTLVARPGSAGGMVHSVFASEPAKAARAPEAATKMPSILRVESRQLDYSDQRREAVFAGPVRIDGTMGLLGEVRGQRTTVFFSPAVKGSSKSGGVEGGPIGVPLGGSLDHVVVAGDVKLEQPGRRGTGEQLVYKAADGSFVLTGAPGAPPRILDAQQGSVTGASLMFRAGDSTIVVTGGRGVGDERPQRAHIETHMRQKAK